MQNELKQFITTESKTIFKFKPIQRLWHIPVLAGISVALPMFVGILFGNPKNGFIAGCTGLLILYLPFHSQSFAKRMVTILACAFGFMISYAIGIVFSFNPWISSVVFALFAIFAHWTAKIFRVKPPGSFFFIMLCAIASCQKFDLSQIPVKIGLISLGALSTCTLAFIYNLIVLKDYSYIDKTENEQAHNKYAYLTEAIIIGISLLASMATAHLLAFKNPYWIPISCLAVLQGVNVMHVWTRSIQRIIGTLLGLLLCWFLISHFNTPIAIAVIILMLQITIEFFIVKQYTWAVVFITPLTILLAEGSNGVISTPDILLKTRFIETFIGAIIGMIGGYFIYHEKIKRLAILQLKKTKQLINFKQQDSPIY